MQKLEIMLLLRSLKALHANGMHKEAEKVIDEVIADAEGKRSSESKTDS